MTATTAAALRDPVDAFVALVADKGYGAVSLAEVARECGLGLAELYRRHRDKPHLVAAFMARIDGDVLDGTPRQSDPEETARDRLFDVMMRRYDALKPYRAALGAIRRAGTRDPLLALALGPALRRSMGAMLEAAALTSDGLAGAVRQNGLLALHAAFLPVFGRDETADLSKTMAALDGRLKTAERWVQVVEKYTTSRPNRVRQEEASGPAP